jgi:limonene 1,2-monooxygenase
MQLTHVPLKHGIFLAPFHAVAESPTIALRRDLELVQWVDQLGYDEAWFGEHHSGGFEIVGSPELMIAAAAEMTKRIRFGTGVVTLCYHNPLMVANRIVQLDHMTMGRTMFGVGPGLLPTDARMLGLEGKMLREMMVEALEVILRLFDGEEVTVRTPWFTLDRARLHLLPYTYPRPEVSVASAVTPSGGMTAGQFGCGMLCVAATGRSGFDVLGTNWAIANKVAAEHGRQMDPQQLRLVGPMHIAETRTKARENVKFGLEKYCEYYERATPKGVAITDVLNGKDPADSLVESGNAVIGTPDDAIAQIERLRAKQGDFGVFLHQATNWADWDATKKSYELYARFVIPHFSKVNRSRQISYDHFAKNAETLRETRQPGIDAAFAKWNEKKAELDGR